MHDIIHILHYLEGDASEYSPRGDKTAWNVMSPIEKALVSPRDKYSGIIAGEEV